MIFEIDQIYLTKNGSQIKIVAIYKGILIGEIIWDGKENKAAEAGNFLFFDEAYGQIILKNDVSPWMKYLKHGMDLTMCINSLNDKIKTRDEGEDDFDCRWW